MTGPFPPKVSGGLPRYWSCVYSTQADESSGIGDTLPSIFPQYVDQVDHDRDIRDEQRDPDEGEFPGDLVEFEGDQRARGDDDQVLGPVVADDQADPLDRVERGIEVRADLKGAEVRPVDAGD